jgi:hypothetical protein
MYATLPFKVPVRVIPAELAALAIPKSTTFAMPLRWTRMLSGEMSRWTSPSGFPSGPARSCA